MRSWRIYADTSVFGGCFDRERRWEDDATHVALATAARADAIVSWNFKHIVRVDKIRLCNQVNLANGFGLIAIVSPREVRFDDPE